MKTWKTNSGIVIVHLLRGRCNSYVLSMDDQTIIVDTGGRKDFEKLEHNLKNLGYGDKNLSHLVLTHTHYDHCQSAYRLKEIYNCKIIVSEKAEASITDGYTMLPNGTNWLSHTIVKMGRRIGKPKYGYDPFKADILIHGDYALLGGDSEVKIIETPGHSADSISVIVDKEYALVGDTMFGIFRNSVFPPFADNKKLMVGSWKKLLDTGCKTFLPGHGKAISRNTLQSQYEKYARKYGMVD